MPRKIIFPDESYLIKLYTEGTSEKKLAHDFNVSRSVIRRILNDNAIIPRNRSLAMFERMAKTTKEERQKLSSKAHEAIKGIKRKETELIERAKSRQKTLQYVGAGEAQLNQWLIEYGLETIPQLAINRFNIDIAVPPIAVELMVSSCDPLIDRYNPKKIEYLTSHGWAVIYIHIKHIEFLTKIHAQEVASFINQVRLNPSLIGQYRVIGRNAQLKAIGRFDFD